MGDEALEDRAAGGALREGALARLAGHGAPELLLALAELRGELVRAVGSLTLRVEPGSPSKIRVPCLVLNPIPCNVSLVCSPLLA